jgi:hypothetical protein
MQEGAMRNCLSVLVALTVVAAASASAQPGVGSRASLVHAEGDVYLSDRVVELTSAPSILPDGATLRTGQGRAAIALKRGGMLYLDAGASIRVLGNGVYNFSEIEVLTGSAIVVSLTSSPLVQCENLIRLSDAGVFRFDVRQGSATGERSCQFRVFDGAAAVPLASVTNALRAGQTMNCNRRCGDMIPTTEFSRDLLDDFDQWARRMNERLRQ